MDDDAGKITAGTVQLICLYLVITSNFARKGAIQLFGFFCWAFFFGPADWRNAAWRKRFQKKGNSATLRHRRSPHDNPTPNTHIIILNNYVQKLFKFEKNK